MSKKNIIIIITILLVFSLGCTIIGLLNKKLTNDAKTNDTNKSNINEISEPVEIDDINNNQTNDDIEIENDDNVVDEQSDSGNYSLGYFIVHDGYYTDSELKKYKKTDDTSCEVVYIGDKKYNNCNYIIIKDTVKYNEKDTVKLKSINIKYYEDLSECEKQPDESIKCPSNIKNDDYTIEEWFYDKLWELDNFTYTNKDPKIMNFSNYDSDYWEDSGYFGVTASQSFTMPNHNVLFTSEISGDPD